METNSHFATNVYYDRTFDCDAAKILPGEYYYTNKDMLIVTQQAYSANTKVITTANSMVQDLLNVLR